MMLVPRITIVFEPTEEQAVELQGRFAVIALMTKEEWEDLWKLLAALDGFVGQVAEPLLAIRKGLETGVAVPTDALQRLIAQTDNAIATAHIMTAINHLMQRFAMVVGAEIKKERMQ